MMNRISTSLVIAALLAAPCAYARTVNPADRDQPLVQAHTDMSESRCVLSAEDSRCQSTR